MASSTLRVPPQAPPTFTHTPLELSESVETVVRQLRKVQDAIIEKVTPESATIVNTFIPLARADNARVMQNCIYHVLKDVSTDEAVRDAAAKAENRLNEFSVESAMREELFKLLDAVLRKNEPTDPEARYLMGKMHRQHIENGLQLPIGEKRDRFKAIKKRMQEAISEFSKNISEGHSKGGTWLTPVELEGVPDDMLAELKKGAADNEGKLLVVKYEQVLSRAKKEGTRKKLRHDFERRYPENVPLFKEVVTLKDEAARLLGYPHNAAFRTEEKMAKDTEAINDFLSDLAVRLKPGAEKDIEELKEIKKADMRSRGEVFDGNFYNSDTGYYTTMLVEAKYPVKRKQILEYFPLPHIIRSMLEIFEKLFGLVFVELLGADRDALSPSGNGADIVWSDDIQLFAVWDDEEEGSGFLGYLYFDFYSRDGKRDQACCSSIVPGMTREDGSRQYPVAVLLWDFNKPTEAKPCLLPHGEVTFLFHELGHGIHDLVSKTTYARTHGPNGTVVDFGEAPSQLLENWCQIPAQIKALSRHYSYLSPEYLATWEKESGAVPRPPESMPDSMIEATVGGKHVCASMGSLHQVLISTFDQRIYQPKNHEEVERRDISACYEDMRKDFYSLKPLHAEGEAPGHWYTRFQHPITGDYDAGYYSYLFSDVYAKDIFYTFFKGDPMNSKEGRRYRHAVLEKGGSQHEMKTLVDYLGREPNSQNFYKELGLA